MADIRQFLRFQSDDYLTALRDKVAEAILLNAQTTSVSLNGKTTAQAVHIPVGELAQQLSEVLQERGLAPSSVEPNAGMGLVRFC